MRGGGGKREQLLTKTGGEGARRYQHKSRQQGDNAASSSTNSDRGAHAFAENKQGPVRANSIKQEARGVANIIRHAVATRPGTARRGCAESPLVDCECRQPSAREPWPDFVEGCRVVKCAVQQEHGSEVFSRGPQTVRNLRTVGRRKCSAAHARAGVSAHIRPQSGVLLRIRLFG
jgi:hypothetical protein